MIPSTHKPDATPEVPVSRPGALAGDEPKATPGSIPPEPRRRRPVHPIWLARAFLLAGGGEPDPALTGWRRAPVWFLFWGLVIGIVYAAVFRASWKWFGEYQYIRFVPVAIVLAVDLLWGGYRPLVGGLGLLGRGSREGAASDGTRADDVQAGRFEQAVVRLALVVVLLAILKYAFLLSLPLGESEAASWRSRLRPLYPKAIYRPLILMPLWGRWAMTLALCIGRPHPGEPPRLASMAAGARLQWIIPAWLACAVLTGFYTSATAADLARGTVIALGVLLAAYLVSFGLARRLQGQTEQTVLATGLATEFAFLALYLPVVSKVFHY